MTDNKPDGAAAAAQAASTTNPTHQAPATSMAPPPRLTEEDSTMAMEAESDGESVGDDGQNDHMGDAGDAKRPRLRLAHACDRCRRRKIRCDTSLPCGPCSATRNECTFHTPSRRTSKPKGESSAARSSSTGGVKRPHSPIREQSGLEARLAALESMLRDVPPNVHNAFLSSLDARLGGGVGVGLKEGGGNDGVGVAPEALTSFDSTRQQWTGSFADLTQGLGADEQSQWDRLMGVALNRPRRKEDQGVDAMAKQMEGMSFFYEDEIGQAKWQGATSGFPLLSLLTRSNALPDSDDEETQRGRKQAPDGQDLPNPNGLTGFVGSSQFMSGAGSGPSKSAALGGSSGVRSSSHRRSSPAPQKNRFFPDRTPRPHQTLNPEQSWKAITNVIPPDLMDTLVRCYLSTSHLLWPFLHVPSFLADYANPSQWGEPGFACFIVAVCTLSSRHVDDPRVRANPTDPSTAGKAYFELFKRLRDFPAADRPTLYSIQAAFLAAIYAFGLGNLSKAFALQAESITLCLDGGLHRSVDGYDHFDAVEKETRKRTFWAIYSWDKQSAALFGRPPIIHLRDCDVTEPLIVDDEQLTPDGVLDTGGSKANEHKSRLCAFVAAIRLHVILEGVLDAATQPSTFPTSQFLARAAATIARRSNNHDLREEEELLKEWERILPRYWQYDNETTNSRDPVRITQAERLHCLQHLVKMIIYRHRFSGFVAMPAETSEEKSRHLDVSRKAMQSALTIVADHVHISQRGMMTYYGVHVIHQLAQAGRTLVAVILNCRNADFRPLIAPSIEGLRSCVGLLRRFSGRYLCGLRSADIIDEFCRICNIPVDSPRVPDGTNRPSPAWLRPVRKRHTPSPTATRDNSISPAAASALYGEDIMSANLNQMMPPDSLPSLAGVNAGGGGNSSGKMLGGLEGYAAQVQAQAQAQSQSQNQSHAQPSNSNQGQGQGQQPASHNYGQNQNQNQNQAQGQSQIGEEAETPNTAAINALFNTNDFYNVDTPSDADHNASMSGMHMQPGLAGRSQSYNNSADSNNTSGPNMTLYTGTNNVSSPYNDFAMLPSMGQYGNLNQQQQQQAMHQMGGPSSSDTNGNNNIIDNNSNNGITDFTLPDPPANGNGLSFDFSTGYGGEKLAGEGMDTVSDLQGGEQGLSAATILSLLEEGSFDYGAMFTDQAPLPMDFDQP